MSRARTRTDRQPATLGALRIALVHDWLTGLRGGERVLDHLASRFPDAEIHTLIHVRGATTERIDAMRVHTSPLDRVPGRSRHYRKLLPLFPWAVGRLDLGRADLVISTSHAVAKSVHVPPGVPHLAYCFTPMRYVWDQADAYLGRGVRRWASRPLVHALRRFDVATSGPERVTRFVAISNEVADRIRRHYGRASRVVHPPVDLSWIRPATTPPEDYYLLVAGFVPYKRDALAIEAFRRLGRRLVVVGDGPMRARLERESPPNVEFVGRVDDVTLADLYRRTKALVYPQREDFGLVPVEAQGAGRPVIAFGAGGIRDTVRPLPADDGSASTREPSREGDSGGSPLRLGESDATGVFFDRQTPGALVRAIERFEKAESSFEPERLRRWANRFSPARFDAAFDRELTAVVGAHTG